MKTSLWLLLALFPLCGCAGRAFTEADNRQTVQVDVLAGGAGNDVLRGSDFADRLSGDSGNDVIEHTAGDDFVFGGTDPLPGGGVSADSESDTYLVYGSGVYVDSGYPPTPDSSINPDHNVFSLIGTFWW